MDPIHVRNRAPRTRVPRNGVPATEWKINSRFGMEDRSIGSFFSSLHPPGHWHGIPVDATLMFTVFS
jgi:hypothetical protein